MTLSQKLFVLVILLTIGSALLFCKAWRSHERYDDRYWDQVSWAVALLVMSLLVTFLAFQAQSLELVSN